MIYLDNAATSWPKPKCVQEAIRDAMENCGGNPGRGGHRLTLAAGALLYETRERIAAFFGSEDPFRVTFTQNITMAINLVLRGILHRGDHVLVSPMEHNAVMRPLSALGIDYDILPADSTGMVLPEMIPALIRSETRLIIICHESNVNGVIQPIREIGRIAHEHGIPMLADCAQSAGHLPLDIEKDNIDYLCFTGHKGLAGPTGTGGVVFGNGVDISAVAPLICGGTGSLSESIEQPEFMPDRFESGTQNLAGLAGLNASVQWLQEQNAEALNEKENTLIQRLHEGLSEISGIHLYHAGGTVLSITIDGIDNGIAAQELEERYGIMTRIGLHCAPLAHRTLGTFPNGTIRFAVSPFNTTDEMETCIRACRELAAEA